MHTHKTVGKSFVTLIIATLLVVIVMGHTAPVKAASQDRSCASDTAMVHNYNHAAYICVTGPDGYFSFPYHISNAIHVDNPNRNWKGYIYYVDYNWNFNACRFDGYHMDNYGTETLPNNLYVYAIYLQGTEPASYSWCA